MYVFCHPDIESQLTARTGHQLLLDSIFHFSRIWRQTSNFPDRGLRLCRGRYHLCSPILRTSLPQENSPDDSEYLTNSHVDSDGRTHRGIGTGSKWADWGRCNDLFILRHLLQLLGSIVMGVCVGDLSDTNQIGRCVFPKLGIQY